ncbi:MAG: PAS domain-containing protein, partial [Victivallales bacterium]|nr:PAS domain-containing protein [Victivallales bacterium]
EYVICALLVVAGTLLYRERNRFDRRVFLLLIASIAAVIVAELAFTFYVNVYGLSTVVGHFAKIIAFCFMYAALIRIGLTKPCDLLLRDVKHHERELASARRMLQAVLDTTPMRIFWKDRDLTYLGCNKPFATDAGLASPEELVGKEDQQLPWREQADLYQAADRAVIESGEPKHNYEERQTGPDGEELWVKASKIPLRDEAGKIRGVLGCYEDISERKQAEAMLARHAEELGDLNKSMVGREARMVELKKELNSLAAELGREPPYPPVWDEPAAASGQGQTTPLGREPDEV